MSRNGKKQNKQSGSGSGRKHAQQKQARFQFKDRSGRTHSLGGGSGRSDFEGRPNRETREEGEGREKRESREERGPHPGKRDKRRGEPSRGGPQRGAPQGKDFKGRKRGVASGRGPRVLRGSVDKNHKGFAFIIFEDKHFEDLFVNPREAESLFHGDRVEVEVSGSGELIELKVLEHRFKELVGRYSPHPVGRARGGWVVYERKRAREEVFAPKGGLTAQPGDWVRAKLEFHEHGVMPVTADVVEVYGPVLPPSADVQMVAAEFNLVEEHSAQSIKEAEGTRLALTGPGNDLEGREDLRQVPFITIDGETARDFDDAVYVERNRSGHILWVAIADVSHYVTPGTALDKEARGRGTSVYFPERAFHMLPRALSENLCSLKPNEPRLALVARMEFDHTGERKRTEVIEAVIESKRRATYNQIQAEWEANQNNKTWEYAPHFELYQQIRKRRADRGSIDFDLPEAEVVVQPTGEVISIKQRSRLDAHRLIEEFMIAANEAVTEWMMERKWPFVYRIHEEPSTEKLENFQSLAATVGIKFSMERGTSPKVLSELVRRLEGHPAQAMLNTALLRSMKQAIYSSTHGIHFGLASEGYTHFTSPIRRYPDLVVHRLLRLSLRTEKRLVQPLKHQGREKLEEELAEICDHCSYRERLAADAERESIRIKQVRAMVPRLGEEFDARIVGMIETGLFAEVLDPYVEGMISRDSMMDDFYQFNEDRMIFYGTRKRRTFKMGDRIRVRALRADVDRRQIDFGLVESEKSENPETGVPGATGTAGTPDTNRGPGAKGGRKGRQKQPR